MADELELMGAGVHAALAGGHLTGAKNGTLTHRQQGAMIPLHLLGIAHGVIIESPADVFAHIAGLFAIFSRSRLAHVAIAIYDASATYRHTRRI